ncbi:hypothetical protein ACVIVD_000056 [Bradyrhizobium liaoningense]
MPVLMSVLMHGTSVPRVVKSTRESRSSRPPKRGGVVVPLSLRARLIAVKDGISRRSTLIKAIDYMLERWQGLTTFLDDGRLEPDTNTVERSIRPIAIGKKNSLFSGDEGGGETWAILASLLNTAKLNGLDPEAYLVDVLDRMVSGATKTNQLHELLAWNWKAAREAEKRAVA